MSSHLTRLNPPALHSPPGYHHVVVAPAGPTAYLAGQCPLDVDGHLVGDGVLGDQVDQVVANAVAALRAAGAAPEQVVRATVYVVADDPDALVDAWHRLTTSPLAEAFTGACTLVGVARLGFPGQLVEVDLTAALPPG